MTEDKPARTLGEANTQMLTVPEYDDWFRFAHMVDGYTLFNSLGRTGSIADFRGEQLQAYCAIGKCEGSLPWPRWRAQQP